MRKFLLKALKIIFTILGAVITVNAVALFFVSNLNIGVFLTLLLGIFILSATLLPKKALKKIPRFIKTALVVCVCLAMAFASFLVIYGSVDTADHKEDAVIVLGAAVHGKTPSLTLKKRLDCAAAYHRENPDALIVVSGGRGMQEDITEAEAMESYLLDCGVTADKILREDAADSTYKNFTLSKEILDGKLGEEYSVAFITNEYHIFRAGKIATQSGLVGATHIHSNTNLSYLIAGAARECLAVLKYLVFKS